jgi:hypothetical protein
MNTCRSSYLFDSVTQVAVDVFGNAFGNALGNSLADELGRGSQQEDRAGQAGGMTIGDFARMDGASYRSTPYDAGAAWMADVAGRRAANPMYTPALAQDELLGGRDDVNGMDLQSDQYRAPRTYTVQRGDNPASIGRTFFGNERAGAAILAANGLNASVRGARGMQIGQVLTLPDDISEGNLRAGGRLIGADTSVRAQEAAAAAATAAADDQARYDAMRVGAWSGRTSQAAGVGAAVGGAGGGAGGRFETVSSMDITGGGMTGGTEQVWISDGPQMPYAQSVSRAIEATAQIGYGAFKGAVNGVPELAVGALKGYAYIGAGLRDGLDSVTGAQSQNYLGRAIEAGNGYTGQVLSYGDNGLQRMGGYAGELVSPGAYAKAGEFGVMGLRALGPTLGDAALNYMSRTGMLLYAVPEGEALVGGGLGARFGNAVRNDYRATFFEANPELAGRVVVHHAVEQQVLTKFPGVVSSAEINSIENLRGIPYEIT